VAGNEIYRVEIPIIVDDQTEGPLRNAEARVNRFQQNAEKANRKTKKQLESLAQIKAEPIMKVRDQLTGNVLKADKLIRKLDAEKASPLIEAQDRVSAVVTRINAALKALDKGDVEVLAEMKGPLMDEIVKAKSALAKLNNVRAGPIAELRGELFGQLSKATSQLRDIDRLHVEPKATLRERVTMKAREISGNLRQLTSKAWTVVVNAKDRASGIIRSIGTNLKRLGVGVIGGAGVLTKMGIDMFVERENVTMAFETMLGSADAAKKRVEELTKFAGMTPFSRDEIYESSRILEVFTKGALSTGKGLKLVGDVAAGTTQPFNEVALWIGRLYDAMASGRPVGEMTSRLQEMGAISGSQRNKLEQLAKSGKNISQTWPEAEKVFGRFNGQMEIMSEGMGNLILSTKSFFRENVVARWGQGVESVLGPLLTKFRNWRNEHPEELEKLGNTVQGIASRGTEKIVGFFEGAYGRIKEIVESPEFKSATFEEKIVILFEAGLDAAVTWLEGPGAELITSAFTTLGEVAGKAYLAGMKKLGEKTVEELKQGDLAGAAVPAAAMYLLGGGALLKGGLTVGKGALAGGKKAVQSKPVRGLAGKVKTAFVGEDLLQASKRAGTTTQTATKAAATTTKVAANTTAKANRQVVGSSKGAAKQVTKASGSLGTLGKSAKSLGKVAGRAAVPLAIGLEAYDIYKSQDKVKATGKAGGGLAGAALGAKGGAAIGTMILPGIGTVVGGALGGVGGYLAGSYAGGKVVDAARGGGGGAEPAYAEGGGASTNQYLNQEVYEPFREQVVRAESWGRNLIGNFMRGRDSAGMSMTGWLNNKVYEPFREIVNRSESWGRNLIGNFMSGRDSKGMSMSGWLNNLLYEPFREQVNRAESWGRNLIGNFMRGRDSAGMSMGGWLDSQVYLPFWSIVVRSESWGRNLIGNFMRGRDSAGMSMTGWLNSQVYEPFRSVVNRADSWGRNMIGNFISGMESKRGDLSTEVRTLTNLVVNQFRQGLGIASPSKLAFDIGRYTMLGLINGMSSVDVKKFTEKQMAALMDAMGSAGGNVTGWLSAALMATGTPLSWLPGLQRLVQAESSGNPTAVNRISVGGEHATGLLQTLPSTFRSYAAPGMGNIMNPVHNAAAAINYIKSRYGSVYNTPLFRSGGRYVGYAQGDIVTRPHLGLVGEAGPEAIIPLSARMRSRSLSLWEKTGQMLGVRPYEFGGFTGLVPAAATDGGYGSISIVNNVSVSVGGDGSGETPSAREIADEVADEIAMKISSIFNNMPLRR
jgi:hypothetical protein